MYILDQKHYSGFCFAHISASNSNEVQVSGSNIKCPCVVTIDCIYKMDVPPASKSEKRCCILLTASRGQVIWFLKKRPSCKEVYGEKTSFLGSVTE